MKILLMMVVVQSFNLVIFGWFNPVAGLRILVIRQQLMVYKRKGTRIIGNSSIIASFSGVRPDGMANYHPDRPLRVQRI
jgi:hypothetical protein